MASDAGLTGESGASTAQISNIGTLGTALKINTGTPGDNAVNMMLVMAAALDEQTVPEEIVGSLHHHCFYKHLFSAGGKFAEVQVTGDATSPLRNGLVSLGNIAGFTCYKSTALVSNGGVDQVTLTGLQLTEQRTSASQVTSLQLQLLRTLRRPKLYVQLKPLATSFAVCMFLVVKYYVQRQSAVPLLALINRET